MAESGTVRVSEFRNRKELRHECSVTLNGSGTGQTVINLSSSFANTPTIKVHPPLGNTGETKYVGTYAATPTITVDVTADTAFASKTIEVIVHAMEPA